MLDSFEILTTSGVVLWSRKYAPVGVNIINALIKDVLIEERDFVVGADASAARNAPYKKDKYTLKWATSKDLGLVFVVRRVKTSVYADRPLNVPTGRLPITTSVIMD